VKIPLFSEIELSSELKTEITMVQSDLEVEVCARRPTDESYFEFSSKGLTLVDHELGKLHLDFIEDRVNYSRQSHLGKNELIAKAVGLSRGVQRVFDATLGLAEDAWFFLRLRVPVVGCERSPVVYLLLKDAVRRARLVFPELPFHIHYADAKAVLRSHPDEFPVVYMDPMFPEKKKSALPRKEMRIFRKWVGDDGDITELFETAMEHATERVVVKRPNKAPDLADGVVHSFKGKTVRYDLYSPRREK